ncbi:serine/threonine protein kinase [Nonomuraea sp. NN258]|uniref:serine/threonine-protein kinase n=1 Tax=Nonomuraea antri TaxID=2730852 RepID=UPI001569A3F6|nr:serine/threonine-protein kinase [Nonomuraea antri]NRQ37680.1 serine/threonine protein kinase [Nonomuraea antri]
MTLLVGRYRLLSQLGQGGMGTVWQAMDELLRQEVAIKEVRLPPDLDEASRVALTERTLREARAAARLRSHPSIVTVLDVVLDGGRPWIVMELVRGRSLDRAVRDHGPLPARQVAWIGLRMLDALGAAHASGILHRDVKPANVMLTDDGRVLLTDFGIATIAGDAALTQTGLLAGSPGFIAPERLRGESDGPPADLWSLGATLFTAVEGSAPFARANPAASMAAVLMQEPAPPRLAGPLGPVLAAILEKDPARRCSSDRAAEWLHDIAQGAPMAGPHPHPHPHPNPHPNPNPSPNRERTTAPGHRRERRRTSMVVTAAIAAALAVTAGVVVLMQVLPDRSAATGGPVTSRATSSAPVSPKVQTLFKGDIEACRLLTDAKVRALFDRRMKRDVFVSRAVCGWTNAADQTRLSIQVSPLITLDLAREQQKLTVQSLKDRDRNTPDSSLRKGPNVGEGAYTYSSQNIDFGAMMYHTEIYFRMANVWVVVRADRRRQGADAAIKTARLVATAIKARR